MLRVLKIAMAAAVACLNVPVALAQAASAPAAPASTAPAWRSYQSAFDGYRAYRDQPVGDWRRANETVRQAGGWQAYAREAQGGPGSIAPAAPAASTPSGAASGAHSGHH